MFRLRMILIPRETLKNKSQNRGQFMSFIACTQPCIYQQDGQCNLSRSTSPGLPAHQGCIHFVPLNQGSQRLTNIRNPNQL